MRRVTNKGVRREAVIHKPFAYISLLKVQSLVDFNGNKTNHSLPVTLLILNIGV